MNMTVLDLLKGSLIVSCQALPEEPLYGSNIMEKMALAAEMGGAKGIRANSPEDIRAIKQTVKLPLIGLWKRDYPNTEVYITPVIEDAKQVLDAGADIVALDATRRNRPNSEKLIDIVKYLKNNYSCLLMADVSNLEEGLYAESIGFDIVSSTLSGYTSSSPKQEGPDFELIQDLCEQVSIPVFAEGRIHTPEQAVHCFELGAFAVVVGGAITRPQQITKQYTERIRTYWK